ncbi:MAG: hypothetical protein HRT47_01675 [Candidatus Caenarcaniphilales bacterium]|nr:hypothetical protein [Candidatus Caenarcaniphilales bacterium]
MSTGESQAKPRMGHDYNVMLLEEAVAELEKRGYKVDEDVINLIVKIAFDTDPEKEEYKNED